MKRPQAGNGWQQVSEEELPVLWLSLFVWTAWMLRRSSPAGARSPPAPPPATCSALVPGRPGREPGQSDEHRLLSELADAHTVARCRPPLVGDLALAALAVTTSSAPDTSRSASAAADGDPLTPLLPCHALPLGGSSDAPSGGEFLEAAGSRTQTQSTIVFVAASSRGGCSC